MNEFLVRQAIEDIPAEWPRTADRARAAWVSGDWGKLRRMARRFLREEHGVVCSDWRRRLLDVLDELDAAVKE